MTTIRESSAVWDGNIESGEGRIKLNDNAQGRFNQVTRYQPNQHHNPESMAAGALAGSYAMTLASQLASAGHTPVEIHTTVRVFLEQDADGADFIPTVQIEAQAQVNNIDHEAFLDIAETARTTCPMANLFAGAEITLEADTIGG